MSDRYGYIGIETLLNFCENSKDHAVTPNDFMMMKRVQIPSNNDIVHIIQETLASEGIYGEENTMATINTLKRIGRNDLVPPCCRD